MKKILFVLSIALPGLLTQLRAISADPDATICSSASIIFCSEFEEGTLSGWDAVNGATTPAIVADTGPFARAGNNVLRLYVAPTLSGANANVIKTFTGAQKVYARWYQKWETGYDFSALNHGSGLNAGYRWDYGRSGDRPDGTDWFSSWLEPNATGDTSDFGRLYFYTYYRGMYMDCANPVGSCWGDHLPCMIGPNYCTKAPVRVPPPWPPVTQTNRWYCLEVMLDGGTPTPTQTGANGAQDFWIDGVEYGPWTSLWHRTTATAMNVNLLALNTFYHTAHAGVGVRYDNVVVSTSRIGCVSPSSAPTSPKNLRIVP